MGNGDDRFSFTQIKSPMPLWEVDSVRASQDDRRRFGSYGNQGSIKKNHDGNQSDEEMPMLTLQSFDMVTEDNKEEALQNHIQYVEENEVLEKDENAQIMKLEDYQKIKSTIATLLIKNFSIKSKQAALETTQFDASESPPDDQRNQPVRASGDSEIKQRNLESEYQEMAKRLELSLQNGDGQAIQHPFQEHKEQENANDEEQEFQGSQGISSTHNTNVIRLESHSSRLNSLETSVRRMTESQSLNHLSQSIRSREFSHHREPSGFTMHERGGSGSMDDEKFRLLSSSARKQLPHLREDSLEAKAEASAQQHQSVNNRAQKSFFEKDRSIIIEEQEQLSDTNLARSQNTKSQNKMSFKRNSSATHANLANAVFNQSYLESRQATIQAFEEPRLGHQYHPIEITNESFLHYSNKIDQIHPSHPMLDTSFEHQNLIDRANSQSQIEIIQGGSVSNHNSLAQNPLLNQISPIQFKRIAGTVHTSRQPIKSTTNKQGHRIQGLSNDNLLYQTYVDVPNQLAQLTLHDQRNVHGLKKSISQRQEFSDHKPRGGVSGTAEFVRTSQRDYSSIILAHERQKNLIGVESGAITGIRHRRSKMAEFPILIHGQVLQSIKMEPRFLTSPELSRMLFP